MKIIMSKHAGFCFGVKRAVQEALRLAREGTKVVTLGDLIHNKPFVAFLAEQGIRAVETVAEVRPGQTVLIRSHGVAPDVLKELEENSIPYVDLTCPYVARIHKRVAIMGENYSDIVIVGKADHPEIIGIKGHAGCKAQVVASVEEALALPVMAHVLVVAQTTLQPALFEDVCAVLQEKTQRLEIFYSICETTVQRQQEVAELAKLSDGVVVIGDENSSNSRKLYEIASRYCKNVAFIADASQLLLENYMNCDIISVVAGASAPDWIIREVRTRMSELEKTTQATEENAVEETVAPEMEAQVTEEAVTETVAEEPVVEEVLVVEEVVTEEEPAQAEQEVVVEEVVTVEAPAEEVVVAEVTEEPAAAVAEDAPAEEEEEASFAEQLEKTFVRIRRGQFVKGTVVHVTPEEVCVNIGYKADGLITKDNLTAAGDVSPIDMFAPGEEIEAEVISLNDGEGNVVLSRKKIEGQVQWLEFVDALDMEAIYEATVTRVIKGGVLAKFSGYDAFIPASQLGLKYVEDLNAFVGQALPVKIVDVDRRQKRFVLSNKAALQEHVNAQQKLMFENFEKGSVVRGVVKRLTDFGAFIDVGGVDGLLHITDISWSRIKHPKDILEENQEIDVKILDVDPDKKKISLGYKQLQPRPWDLVPEKYHEGDIVEGKVVRIAPFGAFVEIEPTVDGLIHISQVTNHRIEKVEDILTLGQSVKAKILEINAEKRRISLSMRALMEPAKREDGEDGEDAPRGERRPRRQREDRGGAYTLPPVEDATTSLADLFMQAGEDEGESEE